VLIGVFSLDSISMGVFFYKNIVAELSILSKIPDPEIN
jgi:hypothetical protein